MQPGQQQQQPGYSNSQQPGQQQQQTGYYNSQQPGQQHQPPGVQTTQGGVPQPAPLPVTIDFTNKPMAMVCPYCHSSITTDTSCEASTMGRIVFVVLLLSGIGALLFFLPLIFCTVTTHQCTFCHANLGTYEGSCC